MKKQMGGLGIIVGNLRKAPQLDLFLQKTTTLLFPGLRFYLHTALQHTTCLQTSTLFLPTLHVYKLPHCIAQHYISTYWISPHYNFHCITLHFCTALHWNSRWLPCLWLAWWWCWWPWWSCWGAWAPWSSTRLEDPDICHTFVGSYLNLKEHRLGTSHACHICEVMSWSLEKRTVPEHGLEKELLILVATVKWHFTVKISAWGLSTETCWKVGEWKGSVRGGGGDRNLGLKPICF